MSEAVIEQHLRDMRSKACRQLLELERLAKNYRDQLEEGDVELWDMEAAACDINSHAMTFISCVDKSAGYAEARGLLDARQ